MRAAVLKGEHLTIHASQDKSLPEYLYWFWSVICKVMAEQCRVPMITETKLRL